jgi:hypothetical protein
MRLELTALSFWRAAATCSDLVRSLAEASYLATVALRSGGQLLGLKRVRFVCSFA